MCVCVCAELFTNSLWGRVKLETFVIILPGLSAMKILKWHWICLNNLLNWRYFNSAWYKALQQPNKHCALTLKTTCVSAVETRTCELYGCSFDPGFDPVADHCCSLTDYIKENMFKWVHRLKAHGSAPTDGYRALVACLLEPYSYWMYHMSKWHQIRHCTFSGHLQYTFQVWSQWDELFARRTRHMHTDRQTFVELVGRYSTPGVRVKSICWHKSAGYGCFLCKW